tara:strand:- start:1180 stop:2961 length:1782 start_codon:yes stop_codon:yes gene_type:complete
MNLRSTWRPNKDEVIAENGVVASMHPKASEAGLEMLRKGGNAIDAAVATGFAISVLEPNNSCIAGVGFMQISLNSGIKNHPAGTNVVIEYGPRAPKAARPDMYKITGPGGGISTYSVEGNHNTDGYQSIAIPGTTGGLCKAHELFGELPLEQVMEPAIQYAKEGYDVYWLLSLVIATNMEQLQKFPGSKEIFLPDGFPPKYIPDPSSADHSATRLKQKDLGDLLEKISKEGADAFYKGDVAAAIEEDMKQNNGLITMEDLAEFKAEVKVPVKTTFRDFEIYAPSAPNGGWTNLQTLNILENFDLKSMGHNSSEYLHTFIEGARHAFADRYHYFGDPDFVEVPLQGLLSKEYAKEISKNVNLNVAELENSYTGDPWNHYADIAIHDAWKYDGKSNKPGLGNGNYNQDTDCTTHFGTADKYGNLVSCTQTAVNSFGSKVVSKGLGILWNNAMIWFNPKPGTNNSIAPYKRPLVNMGPIIACKNGKPYASIGSPGGRKIHNANLSVALNILEFGMGPQEAISTSRVDASGPTTLADYRIDANVLNDLDKTGHKLEMVDDSETWYSFARPSAIVIDQEQKIIYGGSDAFPVAEAKGY